MRLTTRNNQRVILTPTRSTVSLRPMLGRGAKGEDGSNVLPTDTAIKNAIENPTSQTAGALSATIADLVGIDHEADADGTTDDSPAIQALIDNGPGKVSLRSVTPAGSSTPFYLLRGTLYVPYSSAFFGDKYRTRLTIPTDGGSFTGSTVFRCNSDGTTWPKAFPNTPATEIASLFINAKAASDAGHRPVIFEFGGSHHIYDNFAYGVDQLVKQLRGTYADIAEVERNFTYAKPDTANYLMSFIGGGDGVIVRQNGMSHDPAATDRPKFLYVQFKSGFSIEENLNGDVYVKDCRSGRIVGNYFEAGHMTLDVVSAEVGNNHFFMRGSAAGDMAGTPLVITSTDASATSLRGALLDLHDNAFVYTTHLLGDYPTDGTVNFQITAASAATNRARVAVRNLYRQVRSESTYANTVLYGVTCGDANFDAYSHLASREAVYEMGAWLISARLGALESSVGLDSIQTNDDTRVWGGTTGTYYYKVVSYYDTKRVLGRVGTAEQSVAATNGGNAPALVLNTASRCPSMIRVYRGASAGSYDKYVDVPFMAGGRLHDSGTDIGGFVWASRTAGVVDAVNANLDAGFELRPGETGAGSDAYGNAEVFARSLATLPTVGSWRRGDIVYGPPLASTAGVLVGWRRVTDCTTASPAHVLNTDWQPIYATTRGLTRGTGSPNGVVTGDPGDLFERSDGDVRAGSTLYYKETGAGTNTGWLGIGPKHGTGSPNGVVTADVGNTYGRTDGTGAYVKTSGTGNTGWEPIAVTVIAATTALAAIGDAINTVGKFAGKKVWNSTTHKTVTAVGSAAGDVWYDESGSVAHTPV